jgi:hypothetical protein
VEPYLAPDAILHAFDGSGADTVSGRSLARIEGGMIREGWDEWDRLGLARALGTRPG